MEKLGIIGAMDQEVTILIAAMKSESKSEIAGMSFYKGLVYNVETVVVQCGVGKVNAAIATTILIERYNVEAIINTGSAGGLDSSLNIGDVVLGRMLAYNDADATAFGYSFGQIPQMPFEYRADEILLDKMDLAATQAELTTHEGLILTGDSFISNKKVLNRMKENFPSAMVTEMEGAAVAQTAWRFNIPFLVIRSVSDLANEDANISFDKFIIEAGKKSAEMVLLFIKEISKGR
ncbi:5'-methylthioadenosine/adenosylhomocysteine nucleosidase [Lacticigenium naphthae]|uniref:5'-methylthioadenosine/adenosylhomocysteine nucleosidase n=1 Tax=Lacticigenium naphthae TaxID=515351 RepID=UPI00041627AE|nr:5'-methylthioadenosine/adenosylhomocysteine nucleosidase [Lacticigenium naphthae]